MKFANLPSVSISKTRLQGTMQAQLWELLAVFGGPMLLTEPPKVNYEWRLRFDDGMIATIYDWNIGPISPTDVVTWHIGAEHSWLVERVHRVFREKLKAYRDLQRAV